MTLHVDLGPFLGQDHQGVGTLGGDGAGETRSRARQSKDAGQDSGLHDFHMLISILVENDRVIIDESQSVAGVLRNPGAEVTVA